VALEKFSLLLQDIPKNILSHPFGIYCGLVGFCAINCYECFAGHSCWSVPWIRHQVIRMRRNDDHLVSICTFVVRERIVTSQQRKKINGLCIVLAGDASLTSCASTSIPSDQLLIGLELVPIKFRSLSLRFLYKVKLYGEFIWGNQEEANVWSLDRCCHFVKRLDETLRMKLVPSEFNLNFGYNWLFKRSIRGVF
jgi:hypothetical protein